MINIKIICVGKMREAFYESAFAEYEKRLRPLCRLEVTEIPETRLSGSPSERELRAALEEEADAIFAAIPKGSLIFALCIEGETMSSGELAALFSKLAVEGRSKISFIVGGSEGLSERLKSSSDRRISMSRMTFPHHLARVMLAEQIYRAMQINLGTKYHK